MLRKILVIDDDIAVRTLVVDILEREGYHIITAGNGREGFAMALRDVPALIFLDIMMPDTNGLQVLEQLKNDRHTLSIPVIMMSSLHDDQFKYAAAKFDNEDYITKPVEAYALKNGIEKIIKKSELL